jgi:RND superfamily putative drug exporter
MVGLNFVVAGRRGRWIVASVWMLAVVAALALDLPARYAGAYDDDSAAFLPADAESTTALTRIERSSRRATSSVVVVYRRANGLTDSDSRRIAADQEALNHAVRTEPAFRAFSEFAELDFSPTVDAALLRGEIEGGPESETIPPAIEAIRARVSDPGGGLAVAVTGEAAFAADAEAVLDTINGVLLVAAGLLVVALLILIYRSPVLVLAPLAAVACADVAVRAIGSGVAELGVAVNSQSSSIVTVLMLGAGTDYALLLAARYREELRRHRDEHEALALALRAAGPAIAASALTVVAALLCLTFAGTPATRGLGPIGSLGIAVVGASMLTLLPALLAIAGRRAFWRPPLWRWSDGIPRFGDPDPAGAQRRWRRLGGRIAQRPRPIWIAVTCVLAAMALGWLTLDTGLTVPEGFRDDVESVAGQRLIMSSFSAGAGAPTEVFLPAARRGRLSAVEFAVRDAPHVESASWEEPMPGGMVLTTILAPDPYTPEAYELIPGLRRVAKQAGGPDVLVGGATAAELDRRQAAARDARVIVPITLLVVFLVLAALLRALAGPLALIGTVMLSFGATVGLSLLVFDRILGLPGVDPSLPLYAFVFLIALGIDYNIFLMARVREEALHHGTREGMLRALAGTGGVITSAGVVLAGTFSVLMLLPLAFLIEMGFVIAFGVLLDTFVVRSLLVPAIVLDLGDRTWWPSDLRLVRDR